MEYNLWKGDPPPHADRSKKIPAKREKKTAVETRKYSTGRAEDDRSMWPLGFVRSRRKSVL